VAVEIEWKFLVTRLPALPDAPSKPILQGYLDADGRPAVRIRIRGDGARLNIKQNVADSFTEGAPQRCLEFEYPVPMDDAKALLELARHGLAKRRYVLDSGIELDVFSGAHEGLVLAELEVEEGTPAPESPAGWVWRNVSHDPHFTNRWMAEHGLPTGAQPCEIG